MDYSLMFICFSTVTSASINGLKPSVNIKCLPHEYFEVTIDGCDHCNKSCNRWPERNVSRCKPYCITHIETIRPNASNFIVQTTTVGVESTALTKHSWKWVIPLIVVCILLVFSVAIIIMKRKKIYALYLKICTRESTIKNQPDQSLVSLSSSRRDPETQPTGARHIEDQDLQHTHTESEICDITTAKQHLLHGVTQPRNHRNSRSNKRRCDTIASRSKQNDVKRPGNGAIPKGSGKRPAPKCSSHDRTVVEEGSSILRQQVEDSPPNSPKTQAPVLLDYPSSDYSGNGGQKWETSTDNSSQKQGKDCRNYIQNYGDFNVNYCYQGDGKICGDVPSTVEHTSSTLTSHEAQ